MKKLIMTTMLILTLATGAAYAENKSTPLTEQQATERLQQSKPVYSCNMKPEWFSDQPGQCPCCTNDLMKVKEIKEGKAVFDESKQSMPMDMKDMPMKDMNDEDMQKMMENK